MEILSFTDTPEGRALHVTAEQGDAVTIDMPSMEKLDITGDGQVLLTNGYGEVFTLVRADEA